MNHRRRVDQRFAPAALYGRCIIARGDVQRDGRVAHILANCIEEVMRQPHAPARRSHDAATPGIRLHKP